MTHPFSQFSVKDFDKHNCLKISIWYYLALAFLVKGYVVALLSLSNMRDKLGFIRYVYPDPQVFYTSLLVGLPGLLLFALLMARRPNAANWVQRIWPRFYWLVAIAMLIDMALTWGMYALLGWGDSRQALIQTALAILLLVILKRDRRANINLQEFPELIEQEK
ncbi:DUF2919 family protein [Thalassotalea sp. Y01]|uniref:DUF2919 family protein n=1 Tax=Thalassotalea sp. Y01 TaxID=2729613 RepID=UPI00145D9BB2|nr:DUF2919 family protein [Thalassotalea sp. Y01]NMP16743.1 DUF2919 domain-containing protein [Thalassotalea sp. Y01]